jgi:hypothetical protein
VHQRPRPVDTSQATRGCKKGDGIVLAATTPVPFVTFKGRMLLAGSASPTNPVLISPGPIGTPTPRQIGAAYHQVEAIQAGTLLALGDAYRRVQATATQLAARAKHAVDQLSSGPQESVHRFVRSPYFFHRSPALLPRSGNGG